LWNRFRSACDHFFNKKSEFYGGKDESYEENLKAKESLIEEVKGYVPDKNAGKLTEVIEDFQNRFDEVGFVPVKDKDRIRDEFRDAVNGLLNKVETDEETKALLQYRMKITAIVNSPRSDNKLRFERDRVMNKLQQLKNDIGVWENNIGFFKQTESAEETISEFQEKIEDSHSRIELLENKLRIIDEYDET
jgi:archaellum component FlaC